MIDGNSKIEINKFRKYKVKKAFSFHLKKMLQMRKNPYLQQFFLMKRKSFFYFVFSEFISILEFPSIIFGWFSLTNKQ
jgi:hypothetical protein